MKLSVNRSSLVCSISSCRTHSFSPHHREGGSKHACLGYAMRYSYGTCLTGSAFRNARKRSRTVQRSYCTILHCTVLHCSAFVGPWEVVSVEPPALDLEPACVVRLVFLVSGNGGGRSSHPLGNSCLYCVLYLAGSQSREAYFYFGS